MSTGPDQRSDDSAPLASASQILDRLKDASSIKTDAELAAAIGVSKSTIANWRKRNTVRLDKLVPVAKHYGVPVDYLTTGELVLIEGLLARPDIDVVAAIFRNLSHYGYISLPPESPNHGGDNPALRAAIEFRTLDTRAASLLTELLHRGITREDAQRILIAQVDREGAQET